MQTANSAELYWDDIVITTDSLRVKVETLTNFCNSHVIDEIDVLKIDAQGSELNILRGARHLLKRKSIDLLYFEMIIAPTYENQPKMHEYFSFLYDLDYQLVDLYDLVRRGNKLLQMDCLFAR